MLSNYSELLNFFRLFSAISDSDFEIFVQKFKSKTFEKNEIIVLPGQVQQHLYFVKSGVQMSYFESENKQHVIAFTYSPGFCAIPESFLFQKPSSYSLISLTHSEMDYISFHELEEILNQLPAVERLFRKMTEFVLAGMINRHIELKALNMEERFKTFCQRSPHLLQLVPHKYIASYLDIDATNFSKLFNSIKI